MVRRVSSQVLYKLIDLLIGDAALGAVFVQRLVKDGADETDVIIESPRSRSLGMTDSSNSVRVTLSLLSPKSQNIGLFATSYLQFPVRGELGSLVRRVRRSFLPSDVRY